MSEMVERIARAAFEYEQPDNKHFPSAGGWDGPLLNERGKNYYRELARAVIEAMREPTEAMVEAALLAGTNLTVHGPSERLGKRTAGERMADQLRAAIGEALK